MDYNKPATTSAEQIALLEERGMHIADHARAAHYLNHIGYYRLSAYWLPFELPAQTQGARSHAFIAGTTFNQVLSRYIFDRKLRILLIEALERIEVSARSCWVNSFSLNHGSHGYLEGKHFKCPYWHAQQIGKAARALRKSNELFVKHYKDKYTNPGLPPMWLTAEMLSFGELSLWIKKTRCTDTQTVIMRHLDLPTMEIVHGVLHNLTQLRNLCAHHARVWNRRFVTKYPRIKKMSKILDSKESGEKGGFIYNHLVMLRHLMYRINPGTSWAERLVDLLDEQTTETRAAMRLPDEWKKVLSEKPEAEAEK